jgi:hypothetical protein
VSISNDGTIGFDAINLLKKLVKDPGVQLPMKMTSDRNWFLYSVSDEAEVREVAVNDLTGKTKSSTDDNPNPSPLKFNVLDSRDNGIENASTTSRGPELLQGFLVNGKIVPRYKSYNIPADSKFTGAVTITANGTYDDRKGNQVSRSSIVFHEMSENYYRGTGNNYQQAHERAIMDAKSLPPGDNRNQSPGSH